MKDKNILLVDDEKPIRDAFARAFQSQGYTVRTAANAEEALVLMRSEPAHVLFVDLQMPGMNGVELCRIVRKEWPWAIAIAVTGYASLFDLLDCREAGFEDYFIKPTPLAQLLEAAAHAFNKIERWQQREPRPVN